MEITSETQSATLHQRSLFWQVKTIIITRMIAGSFLLIFGGFIVDFLLSSITGPVTRTILFVIVAVLYVIASASATWFATGSVIRTSQIDEVRSKLITNWTIAVNIIGVILYTITHLGAINLYRIFLSMVDVIIIYFLLRYCFKHTETIINRSRKSLAIEQFIIGFSIIAVVLIFAFDIFKTIRNVNIQISTSDEVLMTEGKLLQIELEMSHSRYGVYPKTLSDPRFVEGQFIEANMEPSLRKSNQMAQERFTYTPSSDGQHYKLCATISNEERCWQEEIKEKNK